MVAGHVTDWPDLVYRQAASFPSWTSRVRIPSPALDVTPAKPLTSGYYYPGSKEGHIPTRSASEGSGAFPSLARRVNMQQHAELPCRGNTLAPKKLIRTRRASEGSASAPSLARRVSMCKDAKLSCRGNTHPRRMVRCQTRRNAEKFVGLASWCARSAVGWPILRDPPAASYPDAHQLASAYRFSR